MSILGKSCCFLYVTVTFEYIVHFILERVVVCFMSLCHMCQFWKRVVVLFMSLCHIYMCVSSRKELLFS